MRALSAELPKSRRVDLDLRLECGGNMKDPYTVEPSILMTNSPATRDVQSELMPINGQ